MGNVHGCNDECGIHGKEFLNYSKFHMNSEDLTLKQMFDVTAQLVMTRRKSMVWTKFIGKKNSWTHLSLIGDETVISSKHKSLCLLRFCVVPREDPSASRFQRSLESEKSYRDHDGINGEPTEFEWNIFTGFTTLQLCGKINGRNWHDLSQNGLKHVTDDWHY